MRPGRSAGPVPGGFSHVRTDPEGCSRWLSESGVVAGAEVTVAQHGPEITTLAVVFLPPPDGELPVDYPTEHVRVTVGARGQIVAVPVEEGAPDMTAVERGWLHRYLQPTVAELTLRGFSLPAAWEHLFGGLCLWDPHDPPRLRWGWDRGIDDYLRIVQRHLWFEEYYRRHGNWPVEDAPHGAPPGGDHHPIKNPTLWSAA